MVPYGPVCPHMVLYDPVRFPMVRWGNIRSSMAPYGSLSPGIVPYGSVWSCEVSNSHRYWKLCVLVSILAQGVRYAYILIVRPVCGEIQCIRGLTQDHPWLIWIFFLWFCIQKYNQKTYWTNRDLKLPVLRVWLIGPLLSLYGCWTKLMVIWIYIWLFYV